MTDQVIQCESCGKKKSVDSSTMSRWMGGDKQFFCPECIEELGIDIDDPNIA